jgi:ribosomal protein L37E
MSKRYCSHCGTPNLPTNESCSKCGKPISSALRDLEKREESYHKKTSKARFSQHSDEDDNYFSGDIVMPLESDVVIQTPPKLTIGSLRAGAAIPSFANESLPPGIEVTSRS